MKLVDPSKAWYVLRCFSGREQVAAEELRKLGYDAYCPMMRYGRRHHRTKAILVKEKPLLPGYLFAAQPRRVGEGERVDFDAMQKKPEKHEDEKLFRAVLRSRKDGPFVPIPSKKVVALQTEEIDMAFDDTEAARKHRGEVEKTREAELRERFPIGKRVFAEGIFEHLPGVITRHLKTGRVKIDYETVTVEADMDNLRSAA